jgi:hypothetical protein
MPAIILLLIQHNIFNANNVKASVASLATTSFLNNNIRLQSLLDIAVSIQNVNAVLDLGAHADGVFLRRSGLSHPILIAIDSKNIEIVELLLGHGADPHFGMGKKGALNRVKKATGDDSDIYRLIELAIIGWEDKVGRL